MIFGVLFIYFFFLVGPEPSVLYIGIQYHSIPSSIIAAVVVIMRSVCQNRHCTTSDQSSVTNNSSAARRPRPPRCSSPSHSVYTRRTENPVGNYCHTSAMVNLCHRNTMNIHTTQYNTIYVYTYTRTTPCTRVVGKLVYQPSCWADHRIRALMAVIVVNVHTYSPRPYKMPDPEI